MSFTALTCRRGPLVAAAAVEAELEDDDEDMSLLLSLDEVISTL